MNGRGQEAKVKIVSAKTRGNRGFTSGSGETQLELERRRLKDQLQTLNKELEDVATKKTAQLKRNKDKFKIALIGYTNAGKTALLNTLAKVALESHDRLFETLDIASRSVKIGTGQSIPFMDTVGFISRLPHELVDSFKTTLDEIKDANILIHVRDISHPGSKAQKEVVLNVLKEIMGVEIKKKTVKYLEVLNKSDLVDPTLLKEIVAKEQEGNDYPVIPISATKNKNITKLRDFLTKIINESTGHRIVSLSISYEDAKERIKWLQDNATIFHDGITHDEATNGLKVKVSIGNGAFIRYQRMFEKVKHET